MILNPILHMRKSFTVQFEVFWLYEQFGTISGCIPAPKQWETLQWKAIWQQTRNPNHYVWWTLLKCHFKLCSPLKSVFLWKRLSVYHKLATGQWRVQIGDRRDFTSCTHGTSVLRGHTGGQLTLVWISNLIATIVLQ